MNRIVVGAIAALLLVAAGLFWWQGRAATETGAPPPLPAMAQGASGDDLPGADGSGLEGAAPPEVDEVTREQRRFDRVDRNRDGRVTRNEMLALRADMFRKLDTDHNNLLSFEEWAVRTSTRFQGADGNRDGALTRAEFVATRPKRVAQPQCRCAPARAVHGLRRAAPARAPDTSADDTAIDSGSDDGEPGA